MSISPPPFPEQLCSLVMLSVHILSKCGILFMDAWSHIRGHATKTDWFNSSLGPVLRMVWGIDNVIIKFGASASNSLAALSISRLCANLWFIWEHMMIRMYVSYKLWNRIMLRS